MKFMTKYNLSFFRLIVLVLSLAGLFSCVEPITLKTDNSDPVIVIYGCITDSVDYQSIKISSSSPYFDDQPNPAISDAMVTISTSENKVYLLEESDVKGLYKTIEPLTGKIGVTYQLKVLVDFDRDGVVEVYEASTQMLQSPPIDSIQVALISTMGRTLYRVDLFAQDSPEEDYYMCKYSVNDSLVDDKISKYIMFDDEIYNGQYINGRTISYFRDINSKDKYDDDDDEDRIFLSSGDILELEMTKVEKGYFNFIIQCQTEFEGENPFFGGPASNITTNISNGGVGFFTAVSASKAKAVVP